MLDTYINALLNTKRFKILPVEGGMGDQPGLYFDALGIMEAELDKAAKILADKAKDKRN